VWPIGLSAGVINYSHKTIADRRQCCQNMIEQYDFTVNSYLDNMESELQTELAAWPFRYYIIDHDPESDSYIFRFIPNPSDSEYDLEILFDKLDLV